MYVDIKVIIVIIKNDFNLLFIIITFKCLKLLTAIYTIVTLIKDVIISYYSCNLGYK